MNATAVETIPTEWIDERDVPFFRLTASLFSPEFLLGATVLLASYDETSASRTSSAAERSSAARSVTVAAVR